MLAISLLWPIWQSARNGLSDLYARPAIDFLETKRFEEYAISRSDWQAIEINVQYANDLMPGNPQYLEALGHLHRLSLSLFANDLTNEELEAHAGTSRTYYRAAVANRPTWPYYWGNLALEDYRRGRYSTEGFSRALANTARFGPWKNDAQRLVLDLGGDTWEFLSGEAQRQYVLNLERSLHRQPENTLQIVNEFNLWPDLCRVADNLLDVDVPYLQSICSEDRFIETRESPHTVK